MSKIYKYLPNKTYQIYDYLLIKVILKRYNIIYNNIYNLLNK